MMAGPPKVIHKLSFASRIDMEENNHEVRTNHPGASDQILDIGSTISDVNPQDPEKQELPSSAIIDESDVLRKS